MNYTEIEIQLFNQYWIAIHDAYIRTKSAQIDFTKDDAWQARCKIAKLWNCTPAELLVPSNY